MYFLPRTCRWTAARRPQVPGLDIENGELKRHISICRAGKAVQRIAAKVGSSEFLLSAERSCTVKEHPTPSPFLDFSSVTFLF